jgi:hypothetical protein
MLCICPVAAKILPLDRLSFFAGHISGMCFQTDLPYLAHAGRAVGAEDQAEQFRYPVIEHPAVLGILKFLALGARCKLIAYAAYPHLAPRGLVIFPASRTPAAEICPASPAVQAAAGHQFWIGDDFFHGKFLLNMLIPTKRPAIG